MDGVGGMHEAGMGMGDGMAMHDGGGMGHMMMGEMSGPMILGMHFDVFLMIASGVFYFLCAIILWKRYKQEKNELLGALLAFLVYQTVSMIFMGLEMQTMNMLYGQIAGFAILVGSAYMLKFPFSSFSQGIRKVLFMLSLVVALGLFGWFLTTPERQMLMTNFVLWYDIIVNGIIVGGSIIVFGLRSAGVVKLKALGGGTGVVSCCVVATGAMISGALLTSVVFQFFAPIVILASLFIARNKQQN